MKTPKSAVVVKFTTKTGAKEFAKLMKRLYLNGKLPTVLEVFIDLYHYENEII